MERDEDTLMWSGREFHRSVVGGMKGNCTAEVQEKGILICWRDDSDERTG